MMMDRGARDGMVGGEPGSARGAMPTRSGRAGFVPG